jgi:hypothetical protein
MDIRYMSAPNKYLVRALISRDPTITFNGTVDDAIANTHSLITLAIGEPNTQTPTIVFNGAVGATRPLYSFTAMTLQYREGTYFGDGSITIVETVMTEKDQTYTADQLIFTGATPTLTSGNGTITINVNTLQSDNKVRLVYDKANEPSITVTNGSDLVTTGSDAVAGGLSSGLYDKDSKRKIFGDADDEMRQALIGDVTIETIEAIDGPCDPDKDPNCSRL